MAAVIWLCTLVFAAMALWAFKRSDPMHFWSGSTVKPEELTDVSAYNRANGVMWAVYAAGFFGAGVVSFFNLTAAGILTAILCLPGVIALIIAYKKIYSKYKL